MKNRLSGLFAFPVPRLMSDILFIKTSSLGDVIHHMPAVSDARRHRPLVPDHQPFSRAQCG